MREQFLPAGRAGIVRALAEENVLAGGESLCAQILVKGMRLWPGMHLHIAKILAGGFTHLRLYVAVQGLPASTLAVDALGGGIVYIEWTVAAALRQQAL